MKRTFLTAQRPAAWKCSLQRDLQECTWHEKKCWSHKTQQQQQQISLNQVWVGVPVPTFKCMNSPGRLNGDWVGTGSLSPSLCRLGAFRASNSQHFHHCGFRRRTAAELPSPLHGHGSSCHLLGISWSHWFFVKFKKQNWARAGKWVKWRVGRNIFWTQLPINKIYIIFCVINSISRTLCIEFWAGCSRHQHNSQHSYLCFQTIFGHLVARRVKSRILF